MKTYIVDAFTDKPFAGNPAGVCFLDKAIGDNEMLQIAQELGLSETAFLGSLTNADEFSIRFFSPVMEIPLCGHATLASAKVVFEEIGLTKVQFTNIQNLNLIATAIEDNVVLEFPVYETHPADAPPALLDAIGLNSIRNAEFNSETRILLLEIDDTNVLKALNPDFTALYQSHDAINGVLVTAPSVGDGYDFHSRYFWPWSGTNEDPVTGGTHTFLAKYWAVRLGKTQMRSFQSSKRTGFMHVDLRDEKLYISSQAQIIFKGELRV